MSKTVAVLLIIFIFHLSPVFPTLLASPSCNSDGITYSPIALPPNPSEITFKFQISSNNILENLRGKKVRLRVTQRGWPDYESGDTTITSDTFTLTAGPGGFYRVNPLSIGRHTVVLDVQKDSGIWDERCSGIVYTIGDPKTCVIDPNLPSAIPPDTKLTVRFSGRANTEYTLMKGEIPLTNGKTSTDSNGQGEFKDVKIPGDNGEAFDLKVGFYIPGTRAAPLCSKQITITQKAPQPGPPGTEPVPSAAPGTGVGPGGQPTKPAGPPTVSGGIPCGVGDSGIETAVGCIHTKPAEFAKDILKFAIGIGGGLAFLMMLLGAFQMLTSAGNPDSLKAGQDRLTSAVIGLLFVIFAVLFLQIIGANILGLPDFKP